MEIDDTYVGGKEEGVRGRQTYTKSIVIIAVEVRRVVITKGKRTGETIEVAGRVRMAHLPNLDDDTVLSFIKGAVSVGAEVHTDGHKSYGNLTKNGYLHVPHNIKRSGQKAHVLLPHVHRVDRVPGSV